MHAFRPRSTRRFRQTVSSKISEGESIGDFSIPTTSITPGNPEFGSSLNLLKIQDGDGCPKCGEGELKTTVAIELGHTFQLRTG